VSASTNCLTQHDQVRHEHPTTMAMLHTALCEV
jgi:hypothetical protein